MIYRFEDVSIRRFTLEDIPLKVEWINNPANNKYLHYDLPLEYEKTVSWFNSIKDRDDRFDAVIEYKGEPVGITGLLNIDFKNSRAEYHIVVGNTNYKRKGIATKAGILNALYGFDVLGLNKLYAYIEFGNPSLRACLKNGFNVEGFLRNDIKRENDFVDRYIIGLERKNLNIPDGLIYEE